MAECTLLRSWRNHTMSAPEISGAEPYRNLRRRTVPDVSQQVQDSAWRIHSSTRPYIAKGLAVPDIA
eukprot:1693046-Rhodomonas_salina.1